MKRFLIDSHVMLWWLENDRKLSKIHKRIISEPTNEIMVSIASLFELHIKANLKKIELANNLEEQLEVEKFTIFHISFSHLNALKQLPLHHRDPFDRMIISQAIADKIPVISYDEWFKAYDVELL